MMTQGSKRRELLKIVLAASAGDATEEQLVRFSQLVVEDETLALFAVRLLDQEAWLSYHGTPSHAEDLLREMSLDAVRARDLCPEVVGARAGAPQLGGMGARRAVHELPEHMSTAPRRHLPLSRARRWLPVLPAAAVLLAVGALAGALAVNWRHLPQPGRRAAVDGVPFAPSSDGNYAAFAPYAARFVQGTACVWGPDSTSPGTSGGRLRSGESINLMEGLADIELDLATGGGAILQIEGPARMFLTREGVPSLTLGKFSAKVRPGFGDFTLETPFGQVFVLEETSLGVVVHGLEVEVHVFEGAVEVTSPWTSGRESLDRFHVAAGESLRLSPADSAATAFARGVADPDSFASQISMATDRLRIPSAYVREVMSAGPVLYWRFEDASSPTIRNEVGDRFQGRVVGTSEWSLQDGNQAIEFGTGLTDEALRAYVEATEPLTGTISDSYTIELWVKPSHYHLGALVSFIQNPPPDANDALHGVLLELGGPLIAPTTIEHPGRIRFLHRDPPSSDPGRGTSIFSPSPYEIRRWAYLVAEKDQSEARLYVNGEPVARAEDHTKLSGDFTVLIGQLDRRRLGRRFVGQLDELAIYNRALSDSEIRQHYELVRPRAIRSQVSLRKAI